ncbi:MAG TPA: DedA family protein [Thermoanaerobaculia bacterium]|nr:DedA family protein [Thermoanaerobaculia bacterium]
MSAESLLQDFGYLAVFVGTFLEGEAILIAAGFFASRNYLDPIAVTVVAFAGAYAGHIFWFWLGRVHGVRLLDRFPRMKRSFGKGIRVFERYGAAAIILTQWIYGLRITCAVIIGMSRIGLVKFFIYQAVSCAIWAVIITAAGYYFGRAIERLLGRVEHIEKYGLIFIAVIALGFWLWHRWKEKKEEKEAAG